MRRLGAHQKLRCSFERIPQGKCYLLCKTTKTQNIPSAWYQKRWIGGIRRSTDRRKKLSEAVASPDASPELFEERLEDALGKEKAAQGHFGQWD